MARPRAAGPARPPGGGGSNYFLFVCGKHCGRKRRVADKSGVINVVAEQLVVNLSFFFSFFL